MEMGLTEEQATNKIKGGGRAFSGCSIMPFSPPKSGLAGLCPFCGIGKGSAYNMGFAFPFVSTSFPGLIRLGRSASIEFPGLSDPVSV